VTDWRSSFKGVAAGTAVGIAFGLGGFFLAEIPGTHAMGPVMFFLVPSAAGFAIAIVTDGAQRVYAAAILATLGTLAVLIASGMETPLCAVLAFPLLFLGLMLGIVLAYLFKSVVRRAGDRGAMKSIVFLSVPLVIFAGHRVEMSTLVHPRQEIVTSSIWLPAKPDQVWADLQSFDSLTAEKPLLMYIGLPVPIRCTMQGRGPGAKRTCYFNRGSIEETITEWQPPNRMRLSIDRTNMPGRHWLGFEDAGYDLQQSGDGTILTRNTTIISNLYPAKYWRPFERWGVASEHEYIFADLARLLKY
jgi:hypothetical protein